MRLLLTLALFYSFVVSAHPESKELYFLENRGQVKDQYYNSRTDIQFSVPGNGMTVFIGNGQLHYQFAKPIGEVKFDPLNKIPQQINWDTYRLDMELLNANQQATVTAEEKQDYYENHFLPGNYNTLVAHAYKKITYKNIYPHIDWVLYIKGDKLKHEFVVNEGGDPANIKMRYSGATQTGINTDGSFYANTPLGKIIENNPYSYAQNGVVPSVFFINNDILSFNLGAYTGKLVIDPTLSWMHLLPATDMFDYHSDLTHSSTGNIYTCGRTVALGTLATIGAHQYIYGGDNDGFVSKISSNGNTIWCTYYGGSLQDDMYAIDYDETSSRIYVVGGARSNTNIGTPGTQEPTSDYGGPDAFIVKFDTNGTRIWGTYINENMPVVLAGESYGLTHDESGNIYITGTTASQGMSTAGTNQQLLGGVCDILISKYTPNGFRIWSTYYGGNDYDIPQSVVYKQGNIYLTGFTLSTNGIATNNAYQTNKSMDWDALVAKFDTTGDIVWGTYYGQNAEDRSNSITLLNNNDIVIGGYTSSTNMSTPGSLQQLPGGDVDGFLTRFSNSGNLMWSTYYGGNDVEYLYNICHDPATDNIFATGRTSSNNNIATPGAYQSSLQYSGSFMTRFTSAGTRLWGSYLTTNNQFISLFAIDYDAINYLYVAGKKYYGNSGQPAVYKFYDCQKPILSGSISGEDTVCALSTQAYSGPTALEYNSYNWILPNTWTGSSNTNQINTIAGTVSDSIYFYATNTCGSSDTISKHVLVNNPEATITISGLDLSTTTTFNTYQWYYNGTLITNAINPIYNIGQDGDYYVIVTDAFGCSDTSNTITYTTVSVNDLNKSLNIAKIYPNPATNELTIEGSIKSATILSCDGKKIALYHNFDKQTIDISSFAQGVYFVELETEEGRGTLKFTKK